MPLEGAGGLSFNGSSYDGSGDGSGYGGSHSGADGPPLILQSSVVISNEAQPQMAAATPPFQALQPPLHLQSQPMAPLPDQQRMYQQQQPDWMHMAAQGHELHSAQGFTEIPGAMPFAGGNVQLPDCAFGNQQTPLQQTGRKQRRPGDDMHILQEEFCGFEAPGGSCEVAPRPLKQVRSEDHWSPLTHPTCFDLVDGTRLVCVPRFLY